jgi:hypothetical protein
VWCFVSFKLSVDICEAIRLVRASGQFVTMNAVVLSIPGVALSFTCADVPKVFHFPNRTVKTMKTGKNVIFSFKIATALGQDPRLRMSQ